MQSHKLLAIISLVIVGGTLGYLGYLSLPVMAGTGGGSDNTQKALQVCDVTIYVTGKWEDAVFGSRTVKEFQLQSAPSNCRDARNFDLAGIFKAPLKASIFGEKFWIRADIVDSNGITKFTSGNEFVDVAPLSFGGKFSKQLKIDGVLEGAYQIRVFSEVGFDGQPATLHKAKDLRIPY